MHNITVGTTASGLDSDLLILFIVLIIASVLYTVFWFKPHKFINFFLLMFLMFNYFIPIIYMYNIRGGIITSVWYTVFCFRFHKFINLVYNLNFFNV